MDMLLSTGEQVSIALLSMALQELGQDAISLTGAQVGIVTEADHSRARILNIRTERLQRHSTTARWWWWQAFRALAKAPILKLPPWDGAAPIPPPWP
jgi:aspartate kinase